MHSWSWKKALFAQQGRYLGWISSSTTGVGVFRHREKIEDIIPSKISVADTVLRFANKLFVSAVSSSVLTTDYTLLLEYQSGMVDFTSH